MAEKQITPTLKVRTVMPRKTFFGTVREMIGKITPDESWFGKNSFYWKLYAHGTSVDQSKTNYWLARACFYASEVTDPVTGETYGQEYTLGSAFAKPIVNGAAAFVIGKLPEVRAKNEGEADDQINDTNSWFEENRAELFYTVRNMMRDGDTFVRLKNKDAQVQFSMIAPNRVEKIHDPVSGELTGYDITTYVHDKDKDKRYKYVEELRTTAPFRQVKKYSENGKNPTVVAGTEDNENPDVERPLPIVHFPNEKEPDQIYGNSEYQNCYIYFQNYHAVLENAIKNNIYNSNAVPVFEGIENMDEFLKANGRKRDDGTYEVKWDADKLVIGGKGFTAKILGGVSNASDADKILNILFWLICQTSETPEFIFGTAVASSKASVSEQMPIAVKKAERKQNQTTKQFQELVKLYWWFKKQLDSKVNLDVEYEVKWTPIMDDDLKLNIEIINTLSEQGIITDKTKMIMLNMGRYVSDFDAEIEAAREEMEEKNALADQTNQLLDQAGNEEDLLSEFDEDSDLSEEELALANTPAA